MVKRLSPYSLADRVIPPRFAAVSSSCGNFPRLFYVSVETVDDNESFSRSADRWFVGSSICNSLYVRWGPLPDHSHRTGRIDQSEDRADEGHGVKAGRLAGWLAGCISSQVIWFTFFSNPALLLRKRRRSVM